MIYLSVYALTFAVIMSSAILSYCYYVLKIEIPLVLEATENKLQVIHNDIIDAQVRAETKENKISDRKVAVVGDSDNTGVEEIEHSLQDAITLFDYLQMLTP